MAYDFSQGYGGVAGADPLGIAVQGRGMQRRFQFAQQNPGSSFGPLPSAAWEGLFQAMQENGVNKTKFDSGGQFGSLPSTYNPAFQQSALNKSNPMTGLSQAYQPQSHESWMGSNPAAQAYQKGRK